MEQIINPIYLKEESIKKLQESWERKEIFTHLILTKIFKEEGYKKKEKEIKALKYKRENRPGTYSYAHAKATTLHMLDNKELLSFLSKILKQEIKSIRGEAYYFSWKDYTLLHKKKREEKGIDLIIDFTDEWKEEYGAATIYKNEKGRALKIFPGKNTLSLIDRKNTQSYIQYVNNLTKGKKRYLILAELK